MYKIFINLTLIFLDITVAGPKVVRYRQVFTVAGPKEVQYRQVSL
jgi:hypothetical protein